MEFKYLFFSRLEVQLILRILLKWSFAFLRSSQIFKFSQSFCLSSFHSILSILPEALHCSSRQVPSHWVKFMFYSFHFQSECCLNPFSIIRFLSRSNRSGSIVYLIPWAFNSRHSRRSSVLLDCSRFFASSLQFLLHLILFPFVSVLRSRDEISY